MLPIQLGDCPTAAGALGNGWLEALRVTTKTAEMIKMKPHKIGMKALGAGRAKAN